MKLVPKPIPDGAAPQPKAAPVQGHAPWQGAASASPSCAAHGAGAPAAASNATCEGAAGVLGSIQASTSERGASDDRAD
jgi:hypothetical protein